MRRPLCLFSIIIAAAVFLYLELFSEHLLANMPPDMDGSCITLCGTVSFREYRKDYTGSILPVLYLVPEESSGNLKYVQCYMGSSEDYVPSIGEKVMIEGKVKAFTAPTNPGEFNSLLYYSTQKISYRMTGARVTAASGDMSLVPEYLCRTRFFFEKNLDKVLEPSDSAMLKAILLGDRAYMDEDTKDLYQKCGIIHILSVSALHISILGMGLYEFLRRLKVKGVVAVPFAILFMYVYGTMCGMSTSAFRAILMFSLRLLAPVVKRTYDILTALALAGLLLLIEQPLYLYNSGFLFSFGAIIGIAYVMPQLQPVFVSKKWKMHLITDEEDAGLWKYADKLKESFAASFSIFAVTLPVYASSYYTYPIPGFILNLVVVPLMAPLMIAGLVCLFLAPLSTVLAMIPGTIVHYILAFIGFVCRLTENLPGRTWYIGHTDHLRIALYLVVIAAFPLVSERLRNFFTKKKRKLLGGRAYIYEAFRLGSLIAAMIMLCFQVRPDLKISALDIGQGDAIVIELKDKTVLIDGGSTSKKQVGKYTMIPFLKYEGIGTIDIAVVTHEDMDHISGLFEVMDDMEKGGIRIENLILPGITAENKGENYQKLENRASELGIPITYITAGKELTVPGTGAVFTCLNPGSGTVYEGANEYSTVLHMRYGDFTALFTGDVEGSGQKQLRGIIESSGDRYKNVTLLKVAHHGSEYTTDREFLDYVNPGIALISCGRDNSYGHPHRALLDRLEATDALIYRTDQGGAISIITDGKKCSVSSFTDTADEKF